MADVSADRLIRITYPQIKFAPPGTWNRPALRFLGTAKLSSKVTLHPLHSSPQAWLASRSHKYRDLRVSVET
jgi:hypothetical protein